MKPGAIKHPEHGVGVGVCRVKLVLGRQILHFSLSREVNHESNSWVGIQATWTACWNTCYWTSPQSSWFSRRGPENLLTNPQGSTAGKRQAQGHPMQWSMGFCGGLFQGPHTENHSCRWLWTVTVRYPQAWEGYKICLHQELTKGYLFLKIEI